MRMHLASRRRIQSFVAGLFGTSHKSAGKITLFAVLGSAFVFTVGFITFFEVNVPTASADDVSTSVTVLNTPPTWTVDAQESAESSVTLPTNSGSTITWIATATDSSNDNYYLLICKSSSTPVAVASGAPTCGGGSSDRWGVSAATASAAQASVATTTTNIAPFENELNNWFAYICDGNASLPRCYAVMKQGTGNTASPFVVNHVPLFTAISNDTPANPGETVTWTATASDADTAGVADTVTLLVCKAADFTGTACGAGGTWATSTLVASNPATTTTITIPTPDATYAAYVYVTDNHNHAATSSFQASNSSFVVSNVAPSVTAATISLEDTDGSGDLTLLTPNATSGPFRVRFTTVDNNSCQNASSTAEIATSSINVYRSGIGSASCNESGEFSSNHCYTAESPLFAGLTCSQDGGSCSGTSDTDSTWTCSFPLWFNADPTDAATPWTAENWLASVRVTDDDAASSSFTESTSGNEMVSFLAFDMTQLAIGYGGLEPGESNDPLASTTDLIAVGNVGLDEDLYGDTMCGSWTGPDSCDGGGIDPTSEIAVSNQKFATSSVAYASASAFTLTGSTTPTELAIRVPKTTATSSPQTKDTYWGIAIPGSITSAGTYSGQNTVTAKKSGSAFW